MLKRINDILLTILFSAAGAALVWLDVQLPVLRLAFTIPLVLLLPGYAVTSAVFPYRQFGRAERFLFSLGLSLAAAALGAILLDRTPWGLQARSWTLFLSAIILFASAVALIRRLKSPEGDVGAGAPSAPIRPSLRQGMLLGMAGLATLAAFGLASRPAPSQGIQGYTLLWMLPGQEANSEEVLLGFRSMEFSPTRYRLEIATQGRIIQAWPAIELKTGESWETTLVLPLETGSAGPVEARLYRLDDPGPAYRQVTFWPGR